MSTLKERFDEYKPQPDGRVWEKIEHSLNMGLRRRRMTVTAAAVAAAAAAAVSLALMRPSHNKESKMTAREAMPQAVAVERQAPTPEAVTVDVVSQPEVKSDAPLLASLNRQEEPSVQAVSPAEMPTMAAASQQEAAPVAVLSMPSVTTPSVTPAPAVASTNVSKPAAAPTTPAAPQLKAQAPDTATRAAKPKARLGAGMDSSAVEPVIWIPNAFAPDDPDPKVSQFKVTPANNAAVRSYEVYIYSRQGRMVFHSKDINQAWDGTANGKAQPMGTYVYVMQAYIENMGLQQYKGTITLIR